MSENRHILCHYNINTKISFSQELQKIIEIKYNIQYNNYIYLKNTPPMQISATGFYEYIKIGRTVLWRIDKELTSYIAYKLGTLKEEEAL